MELQCNFRVGDVVELSGRGRGIVRGISGDTLYVAFYDLPRPIGVSWMLVTNLSEAREMTQAEAKGLMKDEL